MPEWKTYTGSNEQISEMMKPGTVVTTRVGDYQVSPWLWLDTKNHPDVRLRNTPDLKTDLDQSGVTEYLICQPHPYAKEIETWIQTGQPVYWQSKNDLKFYGQCYTELTEVEDHPPFAYPEVCNYSFTPFSEE